MQEAGCRTNLDARGWMPHRKGAPCRPPGLGGEGGGQGAEGLPSQRDLYEGCLKQK
jgi:hypothetical protein